MFNLGWIHFRQNFVISSLSGLGEIIAESVDKSSGIMGNGENFFGLVVGNRWSVVGAQVAAESDGRISTFCE